MGFSLKYQGQKRAACLVTWCRRRLWSERPEFRGTEEASHAHWACSPGTSATDMEPAQVPVIDPAAEGALLSAAAGSHKGRLHMEKSLSGPLMRGLGFTSQLPLNRYSASFIFLMAPTGKKRKRNEATPRNRSQAGLARFF